MQESTQKLIMLKFAEQYYQYGFRDLTVTGLCSCIPIARSTFYTYFQSPYEVLEGIVDNLIHGLTEANRDFKHWSFQDNVHGLESEPYLSVMQTLSFIEKNRMFFLALLYHDDALLISRWKGIIYQHFHSLFS